MKYLRIAVLLAGLIMLGGGGLLFTTNYIRAAETQHWPRAQAHITDSRVDTLHRQEVGNEGDFMPHVRYDYVVGGRTYHGDTMWLDERRSFGSANVAARELVFLEAGTDAEVVYNPGDPREAALMIDKPSWRYFFLALLGGLLGWLGWRLGKLPPRPQPGPMTRPGPQPQPQGLPQGDKAPVPAQGQAQLQQPVPSDDPIASALPAASPS